MSKEKRRVPKLRFPGFTEDWEQCKLGSIGSTYTGLSGKTKEDFGHGEAQYITYLNVFQNTISNITMTDKVEIDPTQNEVKYGDVLFTTSSETPEEVGMSSVWLGDTPNIYLNSFCFGFRPNQKIDSYFLGYSLRAPYMRDKIKILAQGISRYNISKNKVMELEISLPNNEEQKLLGTFLQRIDLIITLHQRKLEHLNLKKKALLQKLFPKNGERYPEIRFPGFTDAWEQRKLNEFLSVSNFKNTDNKYNKNNVLSVSGDYGIVNQIEFQGRSFAGVSVSNYGVVETGDIVYTKSPLKLNPYGIIKANRINAGIVSTLYAIYKTKKNCDSKFIEHYFNLDSRLNKYLKPLVNKGAKNDMKVSSENALIGEVCFPHVTEQKLIADFLDRLDLFITLHQRKLEHLQLQKKALLQQMFV